MSKKLTTTLFVIQAIAHLSIDAPDKLYYAGMIAVVGIVYKLAQMRIDVVKTKCGIIELKENTIKEN
jgi:hypothetical protein